MIVTADANKSKVYGARRPDSQLYRQRKPSTTATPIPSSPEWQLTTAIGCRRNGRHTHAITASWRRGLAAKYSITNVNGTLTVTSRPAVTMSNVTLILNKKHMVTQVLIVFSGSVNVADAQTVGMYRLATAGKKNSFNAKNAQIIKIKSAVYSAATNTVTLTPKKQFATTKPVQLRVNGQSPSGLHDSAGALIDGDHDGQPGGNAVALLRQTGATISAVPSIRLARVQPAARQGVIGLL